MFIDETQISIAGGHGGAGIVSFGKKERSGPDGGNGGKGGDAYLLAINDITLLNQFSAKSVFKAENGYPGGRNKRTGRNGEDLEIKIPVGTTVVDLKTGSTLLEMNQEGQRELFCFGGKGGKGNYEFRSPTLTTPEFAQDGLAGQKKEVKLILKLIADLGLIGLPNAGKSSLLNELTNAQAKTADYAFTTLTPNLGVFNKKIIADIPGLIEGASMGKGLGISFLKHIEKVGTLLHCLSAESQDPLTDYETVRRELKIYNKELIKKPEVLVLTKTDLFDEKTIKSKVSILKKKVGKIIPVSIHNWESLENLRSII